MTIDVTPPNAKSAASSPLLTLKDTANTLQVSTKTVRRWIDAGDLVAHRIGRQLRISEQDLQSFIRIRRQG